MHYLMAGGLTVLNTAFLLGVVIGLPGTWLMVAATALVAWWTHSHAATGGQMIGWPALIAVAAIALIGEVVEFAAGVAGSKRFGGSNKAALGALAGTLVGGVLGTFVIPVPLFGSLLGATAGAALGAWLVELRLGRSMSDATRSATGAGLGRLLGTGAKFACGVIIWLIATIAAFWP